MSQKVKIIKVRHVGASVYLGDDKYGNEKYSRNPERIVEWICDGWRYRFNEFRAVRPTRKYVGKDSEDNPIYKDTFLGGDDPVQPGLKSESRARSSWLRAMPSCASPRKIFTSVNMLPSEAKPMYTEGRLRNLVYRCVWGRL